MDPKRVERCDVLIVGAGVAGLSAARRIQERNETEPHPPRSAIILEARDRIGGRVHTVTMTEFQTGKDRTSRPISVDMGATWVHGRSPRNPISQLAKDIDLSLLPDRLDEMAIYLEHGQKVSKQHTRAAWARYKRIVQAAQRYARSLTHPISIQEAIQHTHPKSLTDPIMTFMFAHHIEFDYGGPIGTIEAVSFDTDGEFPGGDAIPVPQGYRPIVDELARGLDIRLSEPVRIIEYGEVNGGAVVTTTTGATYHAQKVICTLPLGVLRHQDVKLSPPLSSTKQHAIARMGWNTVNKVALLFDRAFWPTNKCGFGIAFSRPTFTYILNKCAFTNAPMLEMYAVGQFAIDMDDQKEETIITEALRVVSDMFGVDMIELRSTLVKAIVGRWSQEAYTRGAYSYSSTQTKKGDYEVFQTAERDTLYFAGEHTIQQYRGTVHGAYLSGRRAAEDALLAGMG